MPDAVRTVLAKYDLQPGDFGGEADITTMEMLARELTAEELAGLVVELVGAVSA